MKQHTAPISSACLRARSRPGVIRRGGWTLVELVMVIVLVGSLAAMGAGLLSSVFRSYFASRDITSSDGNGVCFYRDAANNRLMRSADGPATACGTTSAQPVSDFVSGLSFFYYLNDGITTTATVASVSYVTVRVNVKDNVVIDTLRATIHPRNF